MRPTWNRIAPARDPDSARLAMLARWLESELHRHARQDDGVLFRCTRDPVADLCALLGARTRRDRDAIRASYGALVTAEVLVLDEDGRLWMSAFVQLHEQKSAEAQRKASYRARNRLIQTGDMSRDTSPKKERKKKERDLHSPAARDDDGAATGVVRAAGALRGDVQEVHARWAEVMGPRLAAAPGRGRRQG